MQEYRDPYSWWGGSPSGAQLRPITQLILDGVVDYDLAGLLWTVLARRASILVTSSAPRTGKTTLLTALLDFLPPGVDRIFLRGWDERFDFTRYFSPLNSYLLVNKFSPSLPAYFWGPKVVDLFDLLDEGWRLGGTIQGASVEAIADQLSQRDVGLAPSALAQIDLVITLATGIRAGRVWRRVIALHLPEATPAGGIVGRAVAGFDPGDAQASFEPAGLTALADRLGMPVDELTARRARRGEYLEGLVARQVVTGAEVRSALSRFSP